MEKQELLTARNFLYSFLLGFLFPPHIGPSPKELSGYRLVKKIKNEVEKKFNHSGVYENSRGAKVFIKHLSYKRKLIDYYHLLNEAHILRILNEISLINLGKYKIGFPGLINFSDESGNACLITEFVAGEKLGNLDQSTKLEIIRECLLAYRQIFKNFKKETIGKLPRRSPMLMLFSFLLYVMVALLRNPKNILKYARLCFFYYKFAFVSDLMHPKYVLAHKDLHSKNVIVNNNRVTILDHEISVLSEEETDLAIVVRMYLKELGSEKILELIKSFLVTKRQMRNFLKLSIFYSVQLLAIKSHGSSDYIESDKCTDFLLEKMVPSFCQPG